MFLDRKAQYCQDVSHLDPWHSLRTVVHHVVDVSKQGWSLYGNSSHNSARDPSGD